MKKEEAIQILTGCAKLYHENLLNNNLLFVFGTISSMRYFESIFLAQNFTHLTGVILNNNIDNVEFYNMCTGRRLSPADFELKKDGTTKMKLLVLTQVMNIHKTAKMVGDYNQTRLKLSTKKVAGGVHACLGFTVAKESPMFYVPNTVLNENIKHVTSKPIERLLAIFKKRVDDKKYQPLSCVYLAKDIEIESILSNEEIKNKTCV